MTIVLFHIISYDEGSIIIKVGREEPAMSMDVNGGKTALGHRFRAAPNRQEE